MFGVGITVLTAGVLMKSKDHPPVSPVGAAHIVSGAAEQVARWWQRNPDIPLETVVEGGDERHLVRPAEQTQRRDHVASPRHSHYQTVMQFSRD
jgi:hypothetical protein